MIGYSEIYSEAVGMAKLPGCGRTVPAASPFSWNPERPWTANPLPRPSGDPGKRQENDALFECAPGEEIIERVRMA